MRVDPYTCVGCGGCISGYDGAKTCPVGAIALVGNKARIDKDKCISCGQCKTLCALEAIGENE